MDNTEKNVLIFGGLGLAAILLFSWLKQQQLNAIAAANQPGLTYQPSMPYPNTTLGNVLSGISIGSQALGNLFASLPNIGGSNDPGLDYTDETSYPGNDYTYQNSNSYDYGNTYAVATAGSDIAGGGVDISGALDY